MDNELKHYGKLGMRWGVRNRRSSVPPSWRKAGIKTYKQYQRREAIDEYLTSKGQKVPIKMSNKKMREVEKEYSESLSRSKRLASIGLGITGGFAIAAIIAGKHGW